jgi:hypothetical protein
MAHRVERIADILSASGRKPAQFSRKSHLGKAARLRAGGQDVRDPLVITP